MTMAKTLTMTLSHYWRIKLVNWGLHVTVVSGHARRLGAIQS